MSKIQVSFKISSMVFLIVMIMLTVFLPSILMWHIADGSNPYLDNIEMTPLLIQKIEDGPELIKSAEFVELLKLGDDAQIQMYELYKQQTRLQRVLGTMTVCYLLAHLLLAVWGHRRKNET
jgi:hypothetical protein